MREVVPPASKSAHHTASDVIIARDRVPLAKSRPYELKYSTTSRRCGRARCSNR